MARSKSLVWLNPQTGTYYEAFALKLANGGRQRYRGALGTSDRQEAEIEAERRQKALTREQDRIQHLRAAGIDPGQETVTGKTLLEALAKYMTEYGDQKPSAVQMRGYNKSLVAYFGPAQLLGEIGTQELSAFIQWLAAGNMAKIDANYSSQPGPRSLNAVLVHLRAVLNRAKALWKYRVQAIQWSDRYGLPGLMADEPDPPRRVVEEDAEEATLRAALDADTRPLYDFSLLTTVRQANAIFLKKEQVKWDRGIIVFRVKSKKKGGKYHEVPITEDVAAILRAAWDHHPVFVFTYVCRRDHHQAYVTATGKQVMVRYTQGARFPFTKSILRDRWNEARTALGITDLTWHGLRRTGITRTIKESHDPKVAQLLAGHADLATTMRYNVVALDDVRASMEALAARSRAKANRNDKPKLKVV